MLPIMKILPPSPRLSTAASRAPPCFQHPVNLQRTPPCARRLAFGNGAFNQIVLSTHILPLKN
eukprot:m.227493 g.227493  ORF g.227493 m.227493 type:complete len:63 (+) comp17231_c0_seq1:261-449(+)